MGNVSSISSVAKRKQTLWMAYLGWLTTLVVMMVLKALGYSEISTAQLFIFFGLATASHILASLMTQKGIDKLFHFDPHFVLVPNWLFFAPIASYGYYALGSARDVMLVGWLMGMFFLAGYVRFVGIFLTAIWYMICYMGGLLLAHFSAGMEVDFVREIIRWMILLTVCGFYAFLLDRFAAQREHLTSSIRALREKDQEITRLNQKLAKFVTSHLVEKLATDDNEDILRHQRRKITILFSDITAFSTITDALEPEELAQMLNEYFSEMIQIVFEYGGTLDKLMGDGMMVIFGAPSSFDPEQGAWSCVRMALAMQERLEVFNERLWQRGIPYRLQVRMGINTGVSIVGSFGSDMWMNYTAIGGQVNIAARLQQKAEPGEILLSHSTYALLAERVEAEKLGEMNLKGLHHPIHVYRLKTVIDDQHPPVLKQTGTGYYLSLCPDLLQPDDRKRLAALIDEILKIPKPSEAD